MGLLKNGLKSSSKINNIISVLYLITVLHAKYSGYCDIYEIKALKIVCFLTLIAVATYYDFKFMIVPNNIHIYILATSILNTNIRSILGVVVAIPFFIAACNSNGKIGGGDIKFMGACGIMLGIKRAFMASIVGLILAIVINLIYNIIKKKGLNEAFALVPYLSIGCLISIILYF